jgi:diguanylate cyclase (GGDEF)-like protein
MSKNINNSLCQEDILARMRGEEFSIILPNTTLEKAEQVTRRICHTKHTFVVNELNNETIETQVSAGLISMKASE